MKKLFIIFLITGSVHSQKLVDSIFTFKAVDNELVWQKIFTSEIDDLQNVFKKEVVTNMQLENLQEIDNTISFNVKGEKIDFKKYGGTWGNTAVFIQYPQNFLVVIDFKDDRYRVTVKSIKVDFTTSGINSINDFEDYILKKGKIKNNKYIKKMLSYCHKHYTNKFTINVKNEDW